MGQYFMPINVTKREYVDTWQIGGVAKLWEWCANRQAGIFPYLLRRSSDRGGGDSNLACPEYAGRWAGDQVYLVGDYDESDLYAIAKRDYRNIAAELAAEYNRFIELADRQLRAEQVAA